ncbi:MAG: 3-methyl-2-oxobutanoate hydroxymethyltransferase [Deltaproteobacteria bacterium]|nr:3-methyl-2-oxobutanoate hydroxymethyltransferase [Deltaproteobacteria bacterium]
MKKITVPDIVRMKVERRKIAVLTAYNYPMARILDCAGIPVVLVGDSLGMVEAGYSTTLPVTMDEMVYHTRMVKKACGVSLVLADMPFMSYQVSPEEGMRNSGRLVKEGGAEAVKVEGGKRAAHTIRAIVDIDIPVMGHIGLTPQSIHRMGGYKVQGRGKEARERLLEDARAVEAAGAFSIVLEAIPAELAGEITGILKIPTIGIGAGPGCDGQVLVLNDILGLGGEGKRPRFVKRYANLEEVIEKAVTDYKKDVEEGRFPSEEHSY